MLKMFPLPSTIKHSGYLVQVRGTVRDPSNTQKVSHLTALSDALPDHLTLYSAGLLQPGSFDEAVK